MTNSNKHIDKIFKGKFNDYAPVPPEHVWKNIEQNLNSQSSGFSNIKTKTVIAILLVLMLLVASYFLINPLSFTSISTNKVQKIFVDENYIPSTKKETSTKAKNESHTLTENTIADKLSSIQAIREHQMITNEKKTTNEIVLSKPVNKYSSKVNLTESSSSDNKSTKQVNLLNKLSVIKLKQIFTVNYHEGYECIAPKYNRNNLLNSNTESEKVKYNPVNSHWKIGYYLSPELSISNFDSVEILNTYSLNVEPTYFVGENWFLRFGAGVSYVSDRGFAKINFITNDYIGSYNDVYDVTFDTASGTVTPIYHTKSVEVWDSIHHVSVSDVTNKYIYIQIPALFGYYFNKAGSKIGWYFVGGPVFNFKVYSHIDNPTPDAVDADIISLQNNLPQRAGNYIQLWLGVGVEYHVNKKLSIAVEPQYRHYFKSIYNAEYKSTSISTISVRVGLVYSIK